MFERKQTNETREPRAAYLWKPEKLQVELAHPLAEHHCRTTIICRREWRNILEKGSLLIVIPLDGATG
jgi:hypothetical protein